MNCVPPIFSATLSSLELDYLKVSRFVFGVFSIVFLTFYLIYFKSRERPGIFRIIKILSEPLCFLIFLQWMCDFLSTKYDDFSLKIAQVVYLFFIVVSTISFIFLKYNECLIGTFNLFILILAMILGDGLAPNVVLLLLLTDAAAIITGDGLFLKNIFPMR